MDSGNPAEIVVVDACETVRQYLQELLSNAGYSVRCFREGTKALEELAQKHPNIVLTDINLVEPACREFTDSIKSHFPSTTLIIMTDYDFIHRARKASVDSGAELIFKPFEDEEVLKSVRSALETGRMARENERLKETVSLFQMSELLDSSTEGSMSLYRVIVESAMRQTRSSIAMLVLYDEDKQMLEIPYSSFISEGRLCFPRDYLAYPAVDLVLNKCKPVLLTTTSTNILAGKVECIEYSTEAFPEIFPIQKEMLLYPLGRPGLHTGGFIVVSRKEGESSFNENDLQLLGIIASQSSVSVHNAFLVKGLETNYVNTLVSLNAILEAKHSYTKGHTQRVTQYSTTIARELGLSSSEVKIMRDGAMLHDIGKIGISDSILDKPGSLNEAEFDIIREHPIIGEKIIRPIQFLKSALPIIRHHHERMDGRGWPDGLVGVQIPLLVRICTLADSFDAMASSRPYRDMMGLDQIRKELIRHCGTQFDEELVEVFFRLMSQGKITAGEQIDTHVLLQI